MTTRRSRARRGSTLIVVVALLGLFSLFAITTVSVMNLERSAAQNHSDALRARLAARGGLHRAIAELRDYELRHPFPAVDLPWAYLDEAGTGFGAGIPLELARNPSLEQGEDVAGAFSGVVAGTYEAGGDRYKLRIVDAASQVHLGLPTERLGPMLDVLGLAISDELARRGETPVDPIAGRGAEIAALRDDRGGFLRKIEVAEVIGDASFEIAADFLSIEAWEDASTVRRVGWGDDGIPRFESQSRAPICVNTASRPVLIAAFAGVGIAGEEPVSFDQAAALADAIAARRAASSLTRHDHFDEVVDAVAGLDDGQRAALKANANPNLVIAQLNPDESVHRGAGKADVGFATTELCFMTMGIYEIESLGLILDPDDLIVARDTLLASVKIYDISRITTQREFERARGETLLENTVTHPVAVAIRGPAEASVLGGYVALGAFAPCVPLFKAKNNNGHGNNIDRVDGIKFQDGSLHDNKGDDPSGTFDDERLEQFQQSGGGDIVFIDPFDTLENPTGFTDLGGLRDVSPEDGGDILADGLHQSAVKRRYRGYDPHILPVTSGSIEVWVKLDRLLDAVEVPIVRVNQAVTNGGVVSLDAGIQTEVAVARDGDDLLVRVERAFVSPFAEDPLAAPSVPYEFAATLSAGTFAGKASPNEWHKLVVAWNDGTDHRAWIDDALVPSIQKRSGGLGPVLGKAPYEPIFRVGTGIDGRGAALATDLTIDDVVVRSGAYPWDPAALPPPERFEPEHGTTLATYRGSFVGVPHDARIIGLTWSFELPRGYEGTAVVDGAFGVAMKMVLDGLEYRSLPDSDAITLANPTGTVIDAPGEEEELTKEEAREAKKALREEAKLARLGVDAELLGGYLDLITHKKRLRAIDCELRDRIAQLDADAQGELDELEDARLNKKGKVIGGGSKKKDEPAPEEPAPAPSPDPLGSGYAFEAEFRFDPNLAPPLNVTPALEEVTLSYMTDVEILRFEWIP